MSKSGKPGNKYCECVISKNNRKLRDLLSKLGTGPDVLWASSDRNYMTWPDVIPERTAETRTEPDPFGVLVQGVWAQSATVWPNRRSQVQGVWSCPTHWYENGAKWAITNSTEPIPELGIGGKWSKLFSRKFVRRRIQPYKEKNPIEAQLPTPLQPCNVGPLGSMDRMGLLSRVRWCWQIIFEAFSGYSYPCRCLCFGFWQITITCLWRRIRRQFSHILRTELRTFINFLQ